MEHFVDAIKQYAQFTGRTGRKEFWMYMLFYMIFVVVLAILDGLLGTMILGMIFGLAMFVPSLSIGARRLHDVGKSGWWQLITLVPFVGFIILIIFLVKESDGDNEYGSGHKMFA